MLVRFRPRPKTKPLAGSPSGHKRQCAAHHPTGPPRKCGPVIWRHSPKATGMAVERHYAGSRPLPAKYGTEGCAGAAAKLLCGVEIVGSNPTSSKNSQWTPLTVKAGWLWNRHYTGGLEGLIMRQRRVKGPTLVGVIAGMPQHFPPTQGDIPLEIRSVDRAGKVPDC